MTTTVSRIRSRLGLLRAALLLDAAVTGVNAVAHLIAAGPLSALLGYDAGLLRGVGAFLLVFAAAVAVVGTRVPVPRTAAWAVVAVNVVWTAASLAVAATGWGGPGAIGTGWTVLQALVVGGFAALQAAGLRGRGSRG